MHYNDTELDYTQHDIAMAFWQGSQAAFEIMEEVNQEVGAYMTRPPKDPNEQANTYASLMNVKMIAYMRSLQEVEDGTEQ